MNDLMMLNNYREYKEALDTQMTEAAEGFVKIGYLLKLAKDTDVLKESGYDNVNDFAKAEYGIDKTMVSRFISINDRFSENGNSPVLRQAYQGFGYAKLVIMLQLPDALNEELSPDYSKREIQMLKEEIDEEKKITDLEVYAEGMAADTERTQLEQIILKICEENPETYLRLHEAITTCIGIDDTNITELFAPAGEMIYSVRIAGSGRMAVSFKTGEKTISSTNLRTGIKEQYTLEQLVTAVIRTIDTAEEDGRTAWQQLYGRPFPAQEEKIAPVQQDDKPVVRKEKKVQKAKIEKPKPQPAEENAEEEQIPGQDSIMNHSEYLPENSNNMPTVQENIQNNTAVVENMTEKLSSSEMIKNPEETPDFEKDIEESEKTSSEMATNAINTECEDTSEGTESFMNCWEAICEANRKIALFIEDYSTMDVTPDNMAIETARINAVTLANELEHLKTL